MGGHDMADDRAGTLRAVIDPLPLELADQGRLGHLATITPAGFPHVVPVVFTVVGGRVVTPIDWKPKTGKTLQRIANLEANPAVSLVVDHYEEDWAKLWWVRMDGSATLHHEGARRDEAIAALESKYQQYRDRPLDGPVILIDVDRVTFWPATGQPRPR